MTGKTATPGTGLSEKDVDTEPPADDVGGVLYGETDDDEQEEQAEETAGALAPGGAIDWEATGDAASGLRGAEVIQAFVKRLPNAPGVYRMFNEAGDVLYVGKARSLKKRVTNYAQGRGHTNRIARMIARDGEHGVRHHRAPRRKRCCSRPTSSSACGRASTSCCATTSRFPTS